MLWWAVAKDNGYVLKSKLHENCMHPMENDQMIYVKSDDNFVWQFIDEFGITVPSLNGDNKYNLYMKEGGGDRWLEVEGGKNYKEDDHLVMTGKKHGNFHMKFCLEFEQGQTKYFKIYTVDDKKYRMFLTCK